MPWNPRDPTPEEVKKFKGSIWEELGYDGKVCPTCSTFTTKGICLNACHLSRSSQERFAKLMREVTKK